MNMNAYLGLALTLGLAACGSGSTEDVDTSTGNASGIRAGDSVDINNDGAADGIALDSNGDGVPESIDRDGDGKADGLLPSGARWVPAGTGGEQAGNNGNQPSNNNGNVPISGVDEDGGAEQGGTNGVVVMTKATVLCGDSEKQIDVGNRYSCCDSLNGDAWNAPTVKAACMGQFAGPGRPPEPMGSECDGRDDCGSAFCCFVYNPMGPTPGTNLFGSIVQRIHGRQCMTEASCNSTMAASGASAMFSCTKDSDCPQSGKCVAEPSGGQTSAGKIGRPWVKICK